MIKISSPIKTFTMDYFGKHCAEATLEDGHKIYVGESTTKKGWQTIQIWDANNTLVVVRDIYVTSRHEWIHLLAGRLKIHFYVYGDLIGHLHEMIIPHDVGKMCTVKRLGE
jgi:hypothetical protein